MLLSPAVWEGSFADRPKLVITSLAVRRENSENACYEVLIEPTVPLRWTLTFGVVIELGETEILRQETHNGLGNDNCAESL